MIDWICDWSILVANQSEQQWSQDSMDLKVRELLKEVTLDYSPTLSKHVNDTVSAIKDAIDKIPDDLKVMLSRHPRALILCLAARKKRNKFSIKKGVVSY